ncbi:MAG: benzoyl-CoA 2,3-epoxidase subunit BoxB [Gammaproteobacteria bacterium]|nr:benzoyl-CoA 2,3-epoxidase subunit BoxB [Gammaproteobacteria bacterium]
MNEINYQEKIPNNVNLAENRRLQRALEAWQPGFINWWNELGPIDSRSLDVYLRTAISADADGWADFGYVKMPDYRWGIFLSPQEKDRTISFGDHKGEPVWQDVPGEYRGLLRRLIVIQGDTEPASVEQQRILGSTCPSLYDLRNLFQVNVEEGRHLWAMVYLLHAHFGREGREEAELMLERHSGDRDKPRLLGAFNEATPDWLAFYMFTFFTDRDGKFQLGALAESAFDPLARSCRFMLKEEAHHMFVGDSGISRIVRRCCDVMRENRTDNPREYGVIDLTTIQKYLNFHYSVSLDLFGAEVSTNAANAFTAGLKGRFNEAKLTHDDHQLKDEAYSVLQVSGDVMRQTDVPALTVLNENLRNRYSGECLNGVNRWNKLIQKCGCDFQLQLPHQAFNRKVGDFKDYHISPDGKILSDKEWEQQKDNWLPTEQDRKFVASLMTKPVSQPGQYANWIAPPTKSINNLPADFEYVRFD